MLFPLLRHRGRKRLDLVVAKLGPEPLEQVPRRDRGAIALGERQWRAVGKQFDAT